MKCIRIFLGFIIVFIDFIIPVKKVKRTDASQSLVNQELNSYTLYEFYLCPFCVRVRRMMRRLRLGIETRDAKRNDDYRQELLAGGGKVKVPCLRIESDGDVMWMYESKDINAYLMKRFS
ncbi:NrdH-redoxin [Candidatus Marinamargulisbacteria bacterium SCGC AG-414-C22]|nr:NrdH-redoxin [Candidatus Marinamargulisbacteria bacterium SCGC AG-414-C22]